MSMYIVEPKDDREIVSLQVKVPTSRMIDK